ncbi:MAG TPA: fatty acid-binding protein DegV [Clostridiales bacterium]|nr:fatty acid-binding protein DegV [Clostridiales bacterium]
MDFQIITDSCCDFPTPMYKTLGLTFVPLTVEFRGNTFDDKNDGSLKDMYAGLRAGEAAKTSAVNPSRWSQVMEESLAAGKDVLVLAFSSGLSTTYQSAVIAAGELKEKYPERKIQVIDTLCASMGQGLLVWYACRKRDEGLSLEEVARWVLDNRLHLCHWFTVDDLMYLKRGGRISAATALVGTMLQIKPLLHVDDEGHLINMTKARGRKAAIDAMVKKAQELGAGYDNSTMFISHGDCLSDAEYLSRQLKEKCGVKDVVISYVGAVIGSHSGPGTLALFFLGKHR